MAPSAGPLNLDVEAVSGICGAISIAAWVVVFSPQIIENFRRHSADGLSLHFIIIWLLGDVFNILGAVLQGVLPTMTILAVYYTVADLVLLAQCFYYRGFTLKDEVVKPTKPRSPSPAPRRKTSPHPYVTGNGNGIANERTSLLSDGPYFANQERRGSDWSHLSPAVPMLSEPPATTPPAPTRLQTFLWNSVAILMVCGAGVLGWFIGEKYSENHHSEPDLGGAPSFNLWGQIFGWLCAVLYLGSRLPQMLLNFRRKSTEGVSMLFFLFACVGNLTYVLSIFAYEPGCVESGDCRPGEAGRAYGRYILINASWLAGSLGTLFLDLGIFAQFFIYGEAKPEPRHEADEAIEDDEDSIDESRWDQRPLLERAMSNS